MCLDIVLSFNFLLFRCLIYSFKSLEVILLIFLFLLNSKKVNKKQIAYRLIVLTFVVILLLISFLSPFMLIEGANTTLGIAIAGTIFGIYVIVCLALIFDKN